MRVTTFERKGGRDSAVPGREMLAVITAGEHVSVTLRDAQAWSAPPDEAGLSTLHVATASIEPDDAGSRTWKSHCDGMLSP